MKNIAVLVTAHNRVEKTLPFLQSVFDQNASEVCKLDVILVDDGSSDRTAEKVRDRFPEVSVIEGNGQLFWSGGMRLAMSSALKAPRYSAVIWMNDDIKLEPDSILRLLRVHSEFPGACVVGSMRSSKGSQTSYGGVRRCSKWNPLRFELVSPDHSNTTPCDSFNGNLVLIPKSVYEKVGNIPSAFVHSGGDFDYGLRAARLGVLSVVAPGFFGVCDRNSESNTWLDQSLGLKKRLTYLFSAKGRPLKQTFYYAYQNGGVRGVIFSLASYLRVFFNSTR